MAFNGTEGAPISLDEAAEMTKAYRAARQGAVQCEFIGRQQIEALLSRAGSMGIRMYHGINPNGVPQIILVSATGDENDDLGLILDYGPKTLPKTPNSLGC